MRMNVRGGDKTAGLHVGLDHDGFTARLARGLPKDDALAGGGVLDAVACANHW
jgi:hypothetical protein